MGYGAANPLASNALAYEAAMAANGVPYGPAIAPSSINSGGGFRVTSSSPIAARGVTVHSENLVVEGPLAVSGQLPFLGVVALEGPLPAVGQGAVAYGCGNGNIAITNEGVEPAVVPGYANGYPAGMGPAALNYNGLPGTLGYGPIY
ncbi:chorion class B protein M3A5-like [Melitaea cinxia]|uniref:chorion class B protein M3A5-like n=1 Tax=Melitaea cinxia TaxID=113334 RepID=UPI001E270D41|nr:chorion class B protein M3A5-like [Melitaea cinxia]